MPCFECNDTGKCSCIVCRESKSCIVCKGRARWDALRPILEAKRIDPRDRKWWRLDRPEAPAHPHRVFIPEEEFIKLLDQRRREAEERESA